MKTGKMEDISVVCVTVKKPASSFLAAAALACLLAQSGIQDAHATGAGLSAGVDPYFDYRKHTDASSQVGALSDGLFG